MNNARLAFFLSKLWPYLLFGLLLCYFSLLAPHSLLSWGSSTDLVRLAHTGGNYQTPQTQLTLRALEYFMHVTSLSPYSASYLFSSFLASWSMVLFYQLLTQLARFFNFTDQKLLFPLKVTAMLSLLLFPNFILSSIFIERYLLTVFLFLCLSLQFFKAIRQRSNHFPFAFWFIILIGVGISWSLFWTGLLMVFILPRKKSARLWAYFSSLVLFLVFSFLSFQLHLSLLHSHPVEHSFGWQKNIAITVYLERYLSDGYALSRTFDWQSIQESLIGFGSFLIVRYGWWLLAIFALWLSWLLLYRFSAGLFLLLLFVGLQAPFAYYLPSTTSTSAYRETAGLLTHYLVATSIFFVLYLGLSRLKKGLLLLHSSKVIDWVYTGSLGTFMITSLLFGRVQFDLSMKVDEIFSQTLKSLPQDSLLFCFDDLSCSDILYLQTVQKARMDVLIIPYYYNPTTYTLDLERFRPLGYTMHPYILHEIMSTALADDSRQVFSMGISENYHSLLGFNLGLLYYIPQGNYGRLSLYSPSVVPPPKLLSQEENVFTKNKGLMGHYALQLIQNRLLSAAFYFKTGNYTYGYQEMNAASLMADNLPSQSFTHFLMSRNATEQLTKHPQFAPQALAEKTQKIQSEIPFFVENGYHGRALELARGLLLLNPFDAKIRQEVADVYQKIGLDELSALEAQHAQKLLVL